MQRLVVNRKVDIFDYVVDLAIKHHSKPDRSDPAEFWNIATREYLIKFSCDNGLAREHFNQRLHRDPSLYGADLLKWEKNCKKIVMSVSYYGISWHLHKKKHIHLSVNYILVNDEKVFKCQPCRPIAPKNVYWFEY